LDFAVTHVVEDGVSHNGSAGLIGREVFAPDAYYSGEFAFDVHFARVLWPADDCSGRFDRIRIGLVVRAHIAAALRKLKHREPLVPAVVDVGSPSDEAGDARRPREWRKKSNRFRRVGDRQTRAGVFLTAFEDMLERLSGPVQGC
jgi:hypothetical protein